MSRFTKRVLIPVAAVALIGSGAGVATAAQASGQQTGTAVVETAPVLTAMHTCTWWQRLLGRCSIG